MQPDLQSWFGSNYEAAMKIVKYRVWGQVEDQVWVQVRIQVGDSSQGSVMKTVKYRVLGQVENRIEDKVADQVIDQIEKQP